MVCPFLFFFFLFCTTGIGNEEQFGLSGRRGAQEGCITRRR